MKYLLPVFRNSRVVSEQSDSVTERSLNALLPVFSFSSNDALEHLLVVNKTTIRMPFMKNYPYLKFSQNLYTL